jgi:hypothetical protein
MSNIQHLTEKQVETKYGGVFRVKTLQNWRALRIGPRFVRVGRRVFYPSDEIERYLARNLVQTNGSRELDALAEQDDDAEPKPAAKTARRTKTAA